MKNSSLEKKHKELKKWSIIWVGSMLVSLIGFSLFVILTEKKPDPLFSLPWWIFIPVIVGIILAIPFIKKAWEYDKLRKPQNHYP